LEENDAKVFIHCCVHRAVTEVKLVYPGITELFFFSLSLSGENMLPKEKETKDGNERSKKITEEWGTGTVRGEGLFTFYSFLRFTPEAAVTFARTPKRSSDSRRGRHL